MTKPTIAFLEYLRNIGLGLNADFLREGIILLSPLLIGAERYERSEARRTPSA